jgi:hypothetical protein
MPSVLPTRAYADRHTALKTTCSHRPVSARNGARGGDHQAKRELRRRVTGAASGRVANRNALTRASFDVYRRVRRPGDVDHAQLGEAPEKGFRKGSALAHGQHDVEIRQRDGGFILRRESAAKNTKSARAANLDQSALLRATPCQSSRIAILTSCSLGLPDAT